MRYWFLGGYTVGAALIGVLWLLGHAHSEAPPGWWLIAGWAFLGIAVVLFLLTLGVLIVELGIRGSRVRS